MAGLFALIAKAWYTNYIMTDGVEACFSRAMLTKETLTIETGLTSGITQEKLSLTLLQRRYICLFPSLESHLAKILLILFCHVISILKVDSLTFLMIHWMANLAYENCTTATLRDKGRPNILTFYRCPHCERQLSKAQLTSFSTRGNQPFFNLIKAQFMAEPPVPEKAENPNLMPTKGARCCCFLTAGNERPNLHEIWRIYLTQVLSDSWLALH